VIAFVVTLAKNRIQKFGCSFQKKIKNHSEANAVAVDNQLILI
jgi:hypothetical protein